MTITKVRNFQASSTTAGLTATVSIGNLPSAGNLLTIAVGNDTNETIATPSGWTSLSTQTVDSTNIAMFATVAVGNETTVSATWPNTAGNWVIQYTEFSSTVGAWTSAAVDVSANNIPQAAGTALATGTTATTTYANAVAMAAVIYQGGTQSPSWSNAFTTGANTSSSGTVVTQLCAYKFLTATGTQTATATVGTSVAAGWTGAIAVIPEAPGVVNFVRTYYTLGAQQAVMRASVF